MLLVDVLVRYPAVTLLATLAFFAVRDARRIRQTPYILLTAVSVAALLLSTAPPELRLPSPLHEALRIIDIPNVVFIWWLGLSLFDDEFRLGPLEWAGFAAYALPVSVLRLGDIGVPLDPPVLAILCADIVSLAIVAHLAWITLKGRKNDLIERRRAWRFVFVLGLAASTLIAVVSESAMPRSAEPLVTIIRAATVLAATALAAAWMLRFRPEALAFEASAAPTAPKPSVDDRDQALHARLKHLVETDEVFRTPGLSIAALSAKLNCPEHHLRRLINQGLGYRNFSAYLNHYRLAAARGALSEPSRARDPVLTIALETGYNSLAPFNRAFRAETGQTPTEFRKTALAKPVDPEKS